ncbi:MAG: hypothetical protein F6J95_020020 [Leptolyngbya sp. SIO1E4]|nr:hypothetical protein [Leptolyngbya sp. SIO1E4]
MQDRHVSNRTDAAKTANDDRKKLTFQELSEDQISAISGGAGGISHRNSPTMTYGDGLGGW